VARLYFGSFLLLLIAATVTINKSNAQTVPPVPTVCQPDMATYNSVGLESCPKCDPVPSNQCFVEYMSCKKKVDDMNDAISEYNKFVYACRAASDKRENTKQTLNPSGSGVPANPPSAQTAAPPSTDLKRLLEEQKKKAEHADAVNQSQREQALRLQNEQNDEYEKREAAQKATANERCFVTEQRCHARCSTRPGGTDPVFRQIGRTQCDNSCDYNAQMCRALVIGDTTASAAALQRLLQNERDFTAALDRRRLELQQSEYSPPMSGPTDSDSPIQTPSPSAPTYSPFPPPAYSRSAPIINVAPPQTDSGCATRRNCR
jgi:hypothetical protein